MREPRNTRERIQQVAIELFSEQGYERTSLREIAERLDVTKAALYYHFKTKEDITASFLEEFGAVVDTLCEWAEARPRTIETKRELLRRYADVLLRHDSMLRFMHQNQPELRRQDREDIFKRRMRRMHYLLVEQDAPLLERLRAQTAIKSMHMAWFMPSGEGTDPAELHDAIVQLAIEILELNEAPSG